MDSEKMEIKKFVRQDVQLDRTPNLFDLVGKKFVIKAFTVREGAYLQAFIDTDQGPFRTTSKVLLKQLSQMKPDLDRGIGIEVVLAKEKSPESKRSYYTFVAP